MKLAIAAGILLIGLVHTAIAEDNCDAALVRATSKSNRSVHDDWRLASLVDENTYKETKHDAGAHAVIYGVPVGANYGDFQKNIARQYRVHNESRTHTELKNIAWMGLDPNSLGAYGACLQSKVFNTPGLHAAVVAATDSDVSILVKWDVPGNAMPADVDWDPPSIGGTTIQKTIPQGQTTIRIPRPQVQLSLHGNFAGYTTSYVVLDPLPPPPPPWKDYSTILCEATGREANCKASAQYSRSSQPDHLVSLTIISWIG
jgi:hypothetical protein